MRTLRLPVLACLLAVYLVWGTTYFAISVALEGFAPLFQMAIRFLVAGALLMTFQRLRGAPLPTARQWRDCGAIGALLLGCGMGGVATAEQWISSGATTVLIGALPLCAALWSGVFGRRPGALEWLAVLLGSIGVVLLTGGAEFRASPLGTAAILFAITCWSFGSQWSRRLDIPAGASGFAAEMLLGGTLLLIVSALKGESWAIAADWRPLLAWAYLVMFGSLIAFSAYMYLVAHVSPALATSYAYVNPPVALLVGAWLGGETIAPETWTALPLILGAVALLAWAAARTPAGETVAQAQSFPASDRAVQPGFAIENAIDEPRCSAR
ncbi:MAG: drug/metabolite exporter YedA [Rhodocyclaceae bacterium]|nr:drug/metabolite exporter YedA [Rhodocyclaceae bacterium]MCB1913250.1 drug/metabolite exporter YedA [Rhodocyclaceae bacterium]